MKMIVGLGNPGSKYAKTRHNVGFRALDVLVRELKAVGPQEKHHAQLWRTQAAGSDVLLLAPQTFMNLSGESVGPPFHFHKCQPQDLIVIHDELDLPFGAIRIKIGGGNGGHNGLRSIDEHVGAEKSGYIRIRVGIDHPRKRSLPLDVADYVLQKFDPIEEKELEDVLKDVSGAVALVLQGRTQEAMNRYHPNLKQEKEK
jgi:peptidyl-tRNA hydrolase, PTH1 family